MCVDIPTKHSARSKYDSHKNRFENERYHDSYSDRTQGHSDRRQEKYGRERSSNYEYNRYNNSVGSSKANYRDSDRRDYSTQDSHKNSRRDYSNGMNYIAKSQNSFH